MSETITKGYLINREDFELFDEIITFINEYGNVFNCIARGVKKINSKNGRNLFYGSFLEFEFFLSRDIKKVGKLKRVKLLEPNNSDINFNSALLFLNATSYKSQLSGTKFYIFYKQMLEYIKNIKDQNLLVLYIIINLIRLSGIRLVLDCCSSCGSKKIINFSETNFGFVCSNCDENHLKININVLKIIFLIDNKNFSEARKYSEQIKISAIKLLIYFYRNNGGPNLFNLIK